MPGRALLDGRNPGQRRRVSLRSDGQRSSRIASARRRRPGRGAGAGGGCARLGPAPPPRRQHRPGRRPPGVVSVDRGPARPVGGAAARPGRARWRAVVESQPLSRGSPMRRRVPLLAQHHEPHVRATRSVQPTLEACGDAGGPIQVGRGDPAGGGVGGDTSSTTRRASAGPKIATRSRRVVTIRSGMRARAGPRLRFTASTTRPPAVSVGLGPRPGMGSVRDGCGPGAHRQGPPIARGRAPSARSGRPPEPGCRGRRSPSAPSPSARCRGGVRSCPIR